MLNAQPIKIGTPFKGKITALPLADQPEGTVLDSRDMLPRDWKTGRARLSTRPGFTSVGSLNDVAGFGVLGDAFNEAGAVQFMAATASTLYRWTGAAWSSVGAITSSTSRSVHMAGFGKWMFVASNDPYRYYDYDADNNGTPDHTVADYTATVGDIPTDCRLICNWGARIVLAAKPSEPHVVNFSRVDDPFDWDFAEEDTGAAISVPLTEAATCLIPHNRDCLIVGSKGGMHIFRGNPTDGGVVEQFAFVIGPVNSHAWCKSADDYTYILAHNGLYRMAPGCGSPPEDVSRQVIPDGLLGIDGTSTKAYLVYDERFRAVHIYTQGTIAQAWLYDVDGGGFWPITAPGSSILAAHRFGLLDGATSSGAVVATSSGVKRMDTLTALGGSDQAYADILVNPTPDGQKVNIQRGVVQFGSNTTDTSATVKLYGGESPTAAATKGAGRRSSVTVAALTANHGTWFPRVGGRSLVLSVTGASTSSYVSLEGGTLYAVPAGTERG